MRAKRGRDVRQRPDVQYVKIFNEKVVLAISDDKRHIPVTLLDIRIWDMEFVDSVCNQCGQFR